MSTELLVDCFHTSAYYEFIFLLKATSPKVAFFKFSIILKSHFHCDFRKLQVNILDIIKHGATKSL